MSRWSCLVLLVPCAAVAPTVTLNNGVKMPMLTEGSYGYNDTVVEGVITSALASGFRAFDTGYVYNNSIGIGKALNAAIAEGMDRKDIFMATKVPGCGLGAPLNKDKCYNSTKETLELNLQLLNLSYVDLVITHFPPINAWITRSCGNWNGACQAIRLQWKAMTDFYKAGKARAIGVSNYCPTCMDCLKDEEVTPAVNQMMYSLGMGPDPQSRFSDNKRRGVVTQAYSSLGNNPLTEKANPDILHGNLTTRIAKKHSKSTVQVALKWIVSQGIPAVTKSSNPAHLLDDLDLWSWDFDDDDTNDLNNKTYPGFKYWTSYGCNFESIV